MVMVNLLIQIVASLLSALVVVATVLFLLAVTVVAVVRVEVDEVRRGGWRGGPRG